MVMVDLMACRVTTRAEIVDVAVKALERRRIGDVSMSDLAAVAGVSKRLLYLPFADRDEWDCPGFP